MVSSPKPPDPVKTAEAQGAMNRETAITQQELNMVNQNGPWGSVTYDQTGTSASGTPTYTATTSLSPSQQSIFDKSQAAQGNLAQIASDQSGFLSKYLGQGIDLSGTPALQSSFGEGYNPNFSAKPIGLGADYSTSLGDGYATSYAGADDFSADRRRYENALWKRTAGDRSAADAEMRATLANKGIKEGSPAWNAEMERMAAQNTDARLATLLAGGQEQSRMVGLARDAATFGNNAMLSQFGAENAASLARANHRQGIQATQMQAQGLTNDAIARETGLNNSARGQGVSEAFALRNQPINEISALLSGTQVSNPAQMGAATPQTGVAGVDYAGLVNQNYQQRTANNNAMMGGLFGLGSSLIMASDERLKTDVRRVGQTDDGVPVYTYRYIWGGPIHMGVMAQDVPEAAVEMDNGYLAVDYGKVH